MITKLYIENFKGIGNPGIEIDLKPITLLFGANSAGKSTVLQSLQLVKNIIGNNEPVLYRKNSVGLKKLSAFATVRYCF